LFFLNVVLKTAACNNENLGATSSPALNHLLLGKNALLSMKGRRIQGTVPTKPSELRFYLFVLEQCDTKKMLSEHTGRIERDVGDGT
jgi:hypothetical protein